MMNQDSISAVDAAKRLGVSAMTIRRMIRAGEFPNAYKSRPLAKTSPYIIPLSDIEAFEQQRLASTKKSE